jgi:hypothetical protein
MKELNWERKGNKIIEKTTIFIKVPLGGILGANGASFLLVNKQ